MIGTRIRMADFEIYTQGNGSYQLIGTNYFQDSDIVYLSEVLQEIYDVKYPTYVELDLSEYRVLPLQKLGSVILLLYRQDIHAAPMYIAIIVKSSMAQVLGAVLKTLMRRDMVQTFTNSKQAQQWLALERSKQSKTS
jgi:hypothetical protein